MKRLVLGKEGTFHQMYESWLKKYRSKKEFVFFCQISLLLIGIFCFTLFSLIYVNKSSTEGYFLRKANNNFDTIDFSYGIIKTKILELQKENRDQLNTSSVYGPSLTLLDTKVETIFLQ